MSMPINNDLILGLCLTGGVLLNASSSIYNEIDSSISMRKTFGFIGTLIHILTTIISSYLIMLAGHKIGGYRHLAAAYMLSATFMVYTILSLSTQQFIKKHGQNLNTALILLIIVNTLTFLEVKPTLSLLQLTILFVLNQLPTSNTVLRSKISVSPITLITHTIFVLGNMLVITPM